MNDRSDNNTYRAKQAYQNENLAESYDSTRFTSIRGRIGNALDQRALKNALSRLPAMSGRPEMIADVPCGTGRMTRFLLDHGIAAIGADMSFQMMQLANEKIRAYETFNGFAQSDAARMAFGDDSFYCVVCVRFIGHIPRPTRAWIFREFSRVSRYTIIECSINTLIVQPRYRIDSLLTRRSQMSGDWPWHRFDEAELIEELSDGGLEPLGVFAKLPFLSDSHYVLAKRKRDLT